MVTNKYSFQFLAIGFSFILIFLSPLCAEPAAEVSDLEFGLEVVSGMLGGVSGIAVSSVLGVDPLLIGLPVGIALGNNIVNYLYGREFKWIETVVGTYWGGILTAGSTTWLLGTSTDARPDNYVFVSLLVLFPSISSNYAHHFL